MPTASENVCSSGNTGSDQRAVRTTRLTQNGLARILRRLRLEPKHFLTVVIMSITFLTEVGLFILIGML
jgi:hypothetical protein